MPAFFLSQLLVSSITLPAEGLDTVHRIPIPHKIVPGLGFLALAADPLLAGWSHWRVQPKPFITLLTHFHMNLVGASLAKVLEPIAAATVAGEAARGQRLHALGAELRSCWQL
jgi:hypothetical protein